MKIKAQEKILTLNNKPVKTEDNADLTLGMAISEHLLNAKEGGKMKLFILAKKFYEAKGDVEVDDADFALIKKTVESVDVYRNLLISGQVLAYLENIKK